MIRFDLQVRRGSFTVRAAMDTAARVSGLFGPSGSGKSTLILALAGLLEPVKGFVEVGGTVLFDSAKSISLSPEHRRVGVVFQDGRLLPHLTVEGNLRFSRPDPRMAGSSFEEIVHLLDLEPLLSRRVDQLSGGQNRLVAIGRALLSRPRLLLLDEPMTGLDPDLRRRVLAYLLRLKDSVDVKMLYVSHVFADFLALVDETGLLREGRLQTAGTPEEVMTEALGTAEAGSVETTLPGVVTGVAEERAVVDCSGALLELFLPGARPGDPVYVTVGAEEVLLAVGDPPRTSARNILSGRVAEIRRARTWTLVGVDVGPVIWAEITEASRHALGLKPGSGVHLLIKASALRGVGLSGRPQTGEGAGRGGVR